MDLCAQNKLNSQVHNNSVFDTLPIIQAQTKIGSENFPENGIMCDYSRYNYSDAYFEIENFFRMYTQTDFLKPIIDYNNFRNNFNFYVFDLNHQKEKIAAQPIRIEFKFSADVIAQNYVAFALVLSNRLVSISSDGQRHFDLI